MTSFEVLDVLPTFSVQGDATVDEGSQYTLAVANIVDPGVNDVITEFRIDWGDGEDTDTFTLAEMLAGVTHTFVDDTGGVPANIKVTAVTSESSVEETFTGLTVANAAPLVTALTLDNTTIVEGGSVILSGTVVDPGTGDTQTLSVDWGDGGAAEVFTLTAGNTGFSPSHRYADDGNYQIAVTIVDDDGATAELAATVPSLTLDVTVTNAAPAQTVNLLEQTIDESGTATLAGTITDAGINDTHVVTVDWGDGSSENVPVSGNAFSASHVYEDDDPTTTPFDEYTITVTVADENTAASNASTTTIVSVLNSAPVLRAVDSTASTIDSAVAIGETVTLTAEFTDAGISDTHSATIFWGDGTSTTNPTVTYDPATETGTVTATHSYATENNFEITIQVTDDDAGESELLSTRALVGTFSNVAPVVEDQTFSVDENSPIGTVVGTVIASDADAADTLSFAIEIQSEFAIDEQTGEITVAANLLDAESTRAYALEVTVADRWGETDTVTITIQLGDQNEYAPRLVLNELVYEIDERSPNGTVLDTVEVSDGDVDSVVTLSLDPDTPFAIDASGEITVADSAALDFGTTQQFAINVIATDQGGLSDTRFLIINLNDLAPQLVSFTRHDPATITTNADTLVFRATFDANVTNVDATDFVVDGATSATVTSVVQVDGSTYDLTVSGGDLAGFQGVVGVNLSVSQNITDSSGSALPTGEPAIDETYTRVNDNSTVLFSFAGDTETITLSDAVEAHGMSRIDSTLGESVTFANPTVSLTIDTTTGSGTDTIDVQGLDAAFDADLLLLADGDDSVHFQTHPIDIGSEDLRVNAGNIHIAATVSTTGAARLETLASSILGIALADGGQVAASSITLIADSIDLPSGTSVVAGAGTVVVQPQTPGTLIDLGGTDVLAGSPLTLGLSAVELGRIQAGNVTIGSPDSGEMRLTAPLVRLDATDVTLVSSGAIVFDAGLIDTVGGTLLLDAGTVVQPLTPGTDVTAGTVSFADGTALEIRIDGAEVDTGYSQLNVAGVVDLTGAVLQISGSHVPAAGDLFTIVHNASSDPVICTFTGLLEGAVILDFLGSGLAAKITSVGGDGNDVVLELIHGTRIEMTIVHEPSAIGDNGEVTSLPASANWVHEWQSFWVEF